MHLNGDGVRFQNSPFLSSDLYLSSLATAKKRERTLLLEPAKAKGGIRVTLTRTKRDDDGKISDSHPLNES